MNFFRKLFGKRQSPEQVPVVPAPDAGADGVRVFDEYGRQLTIPQKQWRFGVLPDAIAKEWNHPDRLYGVLVTALSDGFYADIIPGAQRLYVIDHDRCRATCVWAIVLVDQERRDEAERVLRDYLAKHGDNSAVLTNLARVLDQRGEKAAAESMLWRALENNPNYGNAVDWFVAIERERGGEAAAQRAFGRIAALAGSWRAQLWLARDALASGDLRHARTLYDIALAHAGTPAPADLLMQMSGDLGNAGHLRTALELVLPRFDSPAHGIDVGNNLIKASLDLGNFDDASGLVESLYARKRPDWVEVLSAWEKRIAEARLLRKQVGGSAMSLQILEGPVWLPPATIRSEVFPEKPQDEFLVAFLGSAVTHKEAPEEFTRAFSTALGRLSRAVPLFLSEQVYWQTRARTATVVPWVNEGGAFVLFAAPLRDEDGARYGADIGARHIVLSHLHADAAPWSIELRLIRTSDAKCLETIRARYSLEQQGDDIQVLARQLIVSLKRFADVQPQTAPAFYRVPDPPIFETYLGRLEQLLAVRSAAIEGAPPEFLVNAREIISGMIYLCLELPANATVRLVLGRTAHGLYRVQPEVVGEFRDKIEKLEREHPVVNEVQELVNKMMGPL